MSDRGDRTEKLYTRLTPEDMKSLRLKAVERDLSVPDAAEEAVRAWIAQKGQEDQGDTLTVQSPQKNSVIKDMIAGIIPGVVPEGELVVPQGETWYEHREIHAKLERILRDGPPGMAADIKGNIDWFTVALEALGGLGDTADRVPGTPPGGRTGGIERARDIIEEHRRSRGDPGGAKGRPRPRKKKTS